MTEFVETWELRADPLKRSAQIVYADNPFGPVATVEQELLTYLLYRAGYQMTATSQEDM